MMEKRKFEELMKKVLEEDRELLRRLANRQLCDLIK